MTVFNLSMLAENTGWSDIVLLHCSGATSCNYHVWDVPDQRYENYVDFQWPIKTIHSLNWWIIWKCRNSTLTKSKIDNQSPQYLIWDNVWMDLDITFSMILFFTFWFWVCFYHVFFCSFWICKFHITNFTCIRKTGFFF